MTQLKTEARIQQDCFTWFHNTYPEYRGLYFEIHNNAFSARSGMKHKAIGRQPGVADNCLLLPGGDGPVFFEFKTPTGRQSEVQMIWAELIREHKYNYFIVTSLRDFQSILNSIL